jgi:hypothetical protein
VIEFWPDPDESNGVCTKPGIYRFTIDEQGIYVGRFTKASRVLREYRKNVAKLIEGRPYRPRDPNGFRHVHRALYHAVMRRNSIFLEIVENVAPELLNERERYWREQVPAELRLNGKRRQR